MSDRVAAPRQRTLHLLDVENLTGSPCPGHSEVVELFDEYRDVAEVQQGDHMVIATSHFAAPVVWFASPREARRRVRSGPDGADLALIDVISQEVHGGRYAKVVIGSGDGIFAEPAGRLHGDGVSVIVVARRGGLSRRLRVVVPDIRLVGDQPTIDAHFAVAVAA